MSKTIRVKMKDGGAAFPTDYQMECPECQTSVFGTTPHSGMSLRDYFAGQALMGVIQLQRGGNEQFKAYRAYMAKTAYELADAMLKERDK